jgi:TusA-related sulfurtransferase
MDMTQKRLDITGTVSPYCLLTVQRKAKSLLPSDELIITCDTIPAATTIIPRIGRDMGLIVDSHQISTSLWEITLRKNNRCNHQPGPEL